MVDLDASVSDFSPQPSPDEPNLGGGFTVQFWGVRGSIPTPGADTVRYGGNTACVEMLVGGKRLIFDGGTGLRVLGKHLLHHTLPQAEAEVDPTGLSPTGKARIEGHIFFTNAQWDRIQGFPFFVPAFVEGNHFHIYGAMAPNGASIKQCLTDQMLRPNFPTPLQAMRSQLEFCNISAGSITTIDDVVIETIALNRFTSALGFRVTWQGHSVVYASDTDHSTGNADQGLLYLAQQADLLIYDGTYADRNYPEITVVPTAETSPWEAAVGVATTANVKELIMFHHNPAHDDDCLDHVEMEIHAHFKRARLAREGMIIQVV